MSRDPALLKWWGGYLEAEHMRGVMRAREDGREPRYDRLHDAQRAYMRAKDYVSLVRLACGMQDKERAFELVAVLQDARGGGALPDSDEETQEGGALDQKTAEKQLPAAAYMLARHLETCDEIDDAIAYYCA